MGMVENEALGEIAKEVEDKLKKVVDKIWRRNKKWKKLLE
jgi:hypothetical protein